MEALTTLTDDALLVEESTMDPLSPLPSFVEMLLVQQASESGRSALSAAVAALAASGDDGGSAGSNSGGGSRRGVVRRMGLSLHRLFARMASRYGEEVCALLTYAVERRCLASESSSGGGSTAAETVYGLTRSRWSNKPPPLPPSRRDTASLPDDNDGGQGGVPAVLGRGVAANGGAAGKNETEGTPLATSVKGESSSGIAGSRPVDDHPEEAGGDTTSSGGYLAPLSDGDRVRSALVAALGPYVKDKLERAFERTRDNTNRERMSSTPSSRNPLTPDSVIGQDRWKLAAREAFVRSYPYVHLAWEGVAFAYQFAYLLGRTAHFTPSLHALGLIVRRVTMEDMQRRERRQRPPRGAEKGVTTTAKTSADDSPPPGASSTPTPSETTLRSSSTAASPHLVRRVRAAAVGGTAALLLVGWAIQVRAELRRRRRRRIADSERRRRRRRDGVGHGDDDDDDAGWSLPPPVPPAIPPSRRAPPSAGVDGGGGGALVPLPPDPGSCPLCLRCPRVNPAAAPSGYVFCYRCLVGHVRDAAAGPSSSSSSSSSPSCPVTGVPCPEDRILRLFETHEG